ncbi:hypothetical protein NC652_038616 [Populus alba x Populus x berolinensis]|nr:hypothetical protein NC652_038616 [Populus alba x Populus x berolinensis]
MHDLFQQIGWKLVRQESPEEPGKRTRTRLWLYKDIDHVLTKNTGTEEVEGIFLYLARPAGAQLSALSFSKMTKPRLLLIFRNARFFHSLQYLSNELRILKWDEYPFKTLPLSFHPEELVDMEGRSGMITTYLCFIC